MWKSVVPFRMSTMSHSGVICLKADRPVAYPKQVLVHRRAILFLTNCICPDNIYIFSLNDLLCLSDIWRGTSGWRMVCFLSFTEVCSANTVCFICTYLQRFRGLSVETQQLHFLIFTRMLFWVEICSHREQIFTANKSWIEKCPFHEYVFLYHVLQAWRWWLVSVVFRFKCIFTSEIKAKYFD